MNRDDFETMWGADDYPTPGEQRAELVGAAIVSCATLLGLLVIVAGIIVAITWAIGR